MKTDTPTPGALAKKRYPMPFTRVELCVFSLADGELRVLLAKRASEPHEGRWALPGGVLRIDLDEDLEAACQRVAQERLGTWLAGVQLQAALGGPKRDPRAPWALSLIYRTAVQADQIAVAPGKRVSELRWTAAVQAATDRRLAFDHAAMIAQSIESLRTEVRSFLFPPALLPEAFTLGEFQASSEWILGHSLDKSSFRRKVEAAEIVEPIEGMMKTGAFRPAQMYRLSCHGDG
jgi:8-oxo-dGTP diphosphatase